jgi:hypothetical protein
MWRWLMHTELGSGKEVAHKTKPSTHAEAREKRERDETGESNDEEEKREREERDLPVERQRGGDAACAIRIGVTQGNIRLCPQDAVEREEKWRTERAQ